MAPWENLILATYTVLALIISIASWRAWWYARSHKVLLLACGFSVLFVKAVFLSIALFLTPQWEALFVPSLALDLIVIALFYVAVLRRSN